jgi:putative intracellular protease/amidase
MKRLLVLPFSFLFLVSIIVLLNSCEGTDPAGPEPEPEPDPETGKKVLIFIAKENTYYSEYIVMKEALLASGYEVDVRSSATGTASVYMLPTGTTISETSNTLPGSDPSQFTSQFKSLFGEDWDAGLNTIPANLTIDGKIQDVTSMENYLAMVIVGGTGALNYRVDGSYEAQGSASLADVQGAAEKLNALALEALQQGKPVMAQCHSASLPVYWKINGGASLLAAQFATGFPEAATEADFELNSVNYRAQDKVVVSSPTVGFNDGGKGDFKIITTRDWYPQTVAHAARTLINILETYPTKEEQIAQAKVLILHGGTIDPSNCGAGNRANDVPCNYGGGAELPADFSHVKNLLETSGSDQFSFVVTDLNITSATLPYNSANQSSIETYLNGFDVVIFFKHWSTGVNEPLQKAIVAYAENGGGVLGLHHALYNDVDDTDASLNKNILVNQLFGAQSTELGWGADRTTYNIINTDYGHFVSTFNIPLTALQVTEAPGSWFATPLSVTANTSLLMYKSFSLFDEIYTNKVFVAGQKFGREENEITPLFSNDLGGPQMHTEGFVKTFNVNKDDKVGKVCFLQPGETRANFAIDQPYGQIIRNAVVWLAN